MNATEHRNLVKKAMRNSRKAYRVMDSAGERLERRLDRLIERKTAPAGNDWNPLIQDFNNYKKALQPLEKSLADMISISNY